MNGNGEVLPRTYDTEQSLRDLGLANIEAAAMFLGETSYPESTPSERAIALAWHRRRVFTEALRAPQPADGSTMRSIEELMNEANHDIINAIAADDGSLEQLFKTSQLREQARLESEKSTSLGFFARQRSRKTARIALQSLSATAPVQSNP